MRSVAPDQLFFVLMGLWIVFGGAAAIFFFLSKNAALKRRLWLPATLASGVLFIGIGLAMGMPNETLLFVVPAVALITWLNARAMKFCDNCGATVYSQNPFVQQKFCSKCGAKLDVADAQAAHTNQ